MVFLAVVSASLRLDPVWIAGVGLWGMTLYLAFSSLSARTAITFQNWLSSIVQNAAASEKQRQYSQEQDHSQVAFWASLLSIIPFVGVGALCYLLCVWGLGTSWAVSFGLMGALISGVYELGRRSTESLD
jgi:hypothetical protein